MAKIDYQDPIKAVHGKLSKESDVVYKELNGTTYASKFTKSNKEPTAAQIAQQEKFKQATAKVAEIMQDIDKLTPYREEWRKQKKYTTLRGFIFNKVIKSL